MVTVSGCEVHIGTGPNCRANELRAGGKARLDLGGQASPTTINLTPFQAAHRKENTIASRFHLARLSPRSRHNRPQNGLVVL
jgi:hypothetical protein